MQLVQLSMRSLKSSTGEEGFGDWDGVGWGWGVAAGTKCTHGPDMLMTSLSCCQ
jgi:hypothetical protein